MYFNTPRITRKVAGYILIWLSMHIAFPSRHGKLLIKDTIKVKTASKWDFSCLVWTKFIRRWSDGNKYTFNIERLFHGAQIARSCWRSEALFSFLLACCSYCRANEGISCLLLLPLLPPRTNQPLSTPITQFGYLPPEAEMQRTRSICSPASHLTMSSYQGLVDKTLLP